MDLPRENETIFQPDNDWQNNACLRSVTLSLRDYGENYRESADALIDAALNDHIDIDSVVHPVIFLYRQYLELILKDIIFRTGVIQDVNDEYPMSHSFNVLWPRAKSRLRTHFGEDAPEQLNYLDSVFEEFTRYDPDSTAFRYPFHKNGNRNLTNLEIINLRHVRETMQRIARFLSMIGGHVEEQLQMKLNRTPSTSYDFEAGGNS